MQNITPQEQDAPLNTHLNVDQTHKEKSTTVERTQLNGTPFTMVKQNNKYFLTTGNYKMTENFDTEEELFQHMNENAWNLTSNLILCILDAKQKYFKDIEEIPMG